MRDSQRPASTDSATLPLTNDTTLSDEYEIARLDSLTPAERDMAAKHHVDQWEAVPSYLERYRQGVQE